METKASFIIRLWNIRIKIVTLIINRITIAKIKIPNIFKLDVESEFKKQRKKGSVLSGTFGMEGCVITDNSERNSARPVETCSLSSSFEHKSSASVNRDLNSVCKSFIKNLINCAIDQTRVS